MRVRIPVDVRDDPDPSNGLRRPVPNGLRAFVLLPLLSGCDDIFRAGYRPGRIEVVAPKHDAHIEAGEVTFLWRPLSGACSYRLTVVSPSFARASRVWADTTLRADSSMRPTASR
ncbi:MAG: hypothetical protein ACLR8Y_10235 [Alistipes indistinctus]